MHVFTIPKPIKNPKAMENKTAVMWLIAKIGTPNLINNELLKLEDINQALEMEKEQIIQTYKIAQVNVMLNPTVRADQHYSETYKKPTT